MLKYVQTHMEYYSNDRCMCKTALQYTMTLQVS